MPGLGTIINVAAIVIGGIIGMTVGQRISATVQQSIRHFLAILVFLLAAKMLWDGFSGPASYFLKQLGIAFLSLILGNAAGKLVGIQRSINKLGKIAQEKFSKAQKEGEHKFTEGFITCTLLFCVGPVSILGALLDGIQQDPSVLAFKGLLDGTATIAFSATFGFGAMAAALPVALYQGTITVLGIWLAPELSEPMQQSLNATGGMLMLCLPLVILGFGKVPLSDYLPSLAIAPLLTWLWLG